ncbi:MAG TPA: septum formation initiator family protein [Candidatus Bathyarchaeia archaeon]|nr:septum formation initiator family protein [Candidatus Bathyarchaeia archaeon]
MKKNAIKFFALSCLCLGECGGFGYLYWYGVYGKKAQKKVEEEYAVVIRQIAGVKKEIEDLEYDIVRWEKNSFYQEKIAREQLQMVKNNDIVYYRKTHT